MSKLNIAQKGKTVSAKPEALSVDTIAAFRDAFASVHADDGFTLSHVNDKTLSDWLISNDGAGIADDDGTLVTELCNMAADEFEQPEPEREEQEAIPAPKVKGIPTINDPRHLRAVALANAFPAEFLKEAEAQGERDIAGKRAVAVACRYLIAGLKNEAWEDLPRPGTREIDPETKKSTGINNPDYIMRPMPTKLGGTTNRPVSFWSEAADSTAQGRALLAEIEKAKNIADEIKKHKVEQPLTIRLSALRRIVRNAATLKFQMDDLNALAGFTVTFEMERDAKGDKVFTSSTKNIRVAYVDPKDAEIDNRVIISAGEMLRLDIEKIRLLGGSWEAFEKARTRKSPEPETPEASFAVPTSAADFCSAVLSIHNYIDTAKLASANRKVLIRLLRSEGQDESLDSIVVLHQWLGSLIKEPALKDAFTAADTKING